LRKLRVSIRPPGAGAPLLGACIAGVAFAGMCS
jgi:hypothetical protein